VRCRAGWNRAAQRTPPKRPEETQKDDDEHAREELAKAKAHQHAKDAHRNGEGVPFELLTLLVAAAAKTQERCRRRDHQPSQRDGVDDQEQQLPGRPRAGTPSGLPSGLPSAGVSAFSRIETPQDEAGGRSPAR
jgi:hypothetical protein